MQGLFSIFNSFLKFFGNITKNMTNNSKLFKFLTKNNLKNDLPTNLLKKLRFLFRNIDFHEIGFSLLAYQLLV